MSLAVVGKVSLSRMSLPMRLMLFAQDHRMLPEAWANGFLLTYGNTRVRDAYLMGEKRLTGWWYYFPLAILFKTPLSTTNGSTLTCWMPCSWCSNISKMSASRQS